MVQLSSPLLLVFITVSGLLSAAQLQTSDVDASVTRLTANGTQTRQTQSTQIPQLDRNETRTHLTIDPALTWKLTLNSSNLTGNLSDYDWWPTNESIVVVNHTHHAFDNFPADLMPEWLRNEGGIILHIFFLLYCCLGLGIVCDIYFLPALEIISDILKLPPDIAGATFMAIGTSAPELFTSLIGTFVSRDDIGVGTILGTAVFNLIVIPAACGFAVMVFCPKSPQISRFPILRDSIFYILTIITLILCIKDNMVDWVESLIMIGLFLVYLVIMYFNAMYSNVINTTILESEAEKTPLLGTPPADKMKEPLERSFQVSVQRSMQKSLPNPDGKDWRLFSGSMRSTMSEYKRARSGSMKRIVFADVDVEDETDWIENNTFCKYFLFPLILVFKITLPKPTRCSYIFTFGIAIVWIGILTYLSVWMVTIIGYTFGLPDTVSGLTLLAAGTSVPEIISSVLVVKKASQADMAICNSIGSNIFDILFCLGVPWLFKSLIWCFERGTFDLAATAVPINSAALPLTTLSLLITIFALIITFNVFDWKLGFPVAITCSIIYVIFVIISCTLEIELN